MIGTLTNHLWQSTVFALVAGLLAAALRSNRANVRYWLWFVASFKFLVNCRVGRKSSATRKAALALAAVLAVAAPVAVGMVTAPLRAQTAGLMCTEPDPAIRLELQSADDKILQVDGIARDQEAQTLARELVDRYPDDFIVHMRYQQWIRATTGPAALIERYKSLAAAHPGNPMFAILYAQALRNTNAANASQAIEILKSVAASPLDPWVHLTLAELYSWGKSADLAQASTHLDAWFGACPTVTNWNALSGLIGYGSAATAANEAATLRAQLENETDPHLLLSWRFVWLLELKAQPAAGPAAVRQQIASDVARLEAIPAPNDNRWPELLETGRHLAANQ